MSKKPKVVITRKRLDAMQDEMSQVLRVGFLRGMTTVRAGVSPDEILRALKKGDFSGLREDIEGKITDVLDPLLSKAITTTSTETIEAMPELPDKGYGLTASNPKLQAYIDSRTKILSQSTHEGVLAAAKASGKRSTLITTLHKEPGLGDAVAKMVTRSVNVGMTLEQRAAMIRDSIGLNDRQAIALRNFRARQEADGVTGSKLLARVAGYNDKMLDYRAEMIGRQEVRNAQNASQLLVWQQAAEDEFIPKSSKKVWHCEQKPCVQWCQQMRGVAVPLDESWTVRNTENGQVIEVDIPSDTHPNCFCSMSVQLGP